MKQVTGWAFVMAATLIGACDDDNKNNKGLSSTDKTFVLLASEANKAEVEFGQLAADRAGSAEVKAFGSQMVSDHTTAMNDLQTLATQKDATVSTSLDEQHA